MNKIRLGTLFSGIGAPEQGAKRVYGDDLELVFACEWDKFARESFKANYEIEDDHFHKDIADMDGTQYNGKVDILIGGSPCQDFSLAGLRKGIDGNKGVLIYEYIRIVEEVKAPVIVYENVKGMLSDKGGRTVKDFVQALREIGYYCHYEVLNTKDYGVPQNRERIFLVGFLDHEAYYRFEFAPKMKLEKRLKDILESDVDEKYYLSDTFISGMEVHKERHQDRGNGFAFSPKEVDDIESVGCLSCGYGTRATDTYLKVPQEGVVGILDIKGNESIRRVYGTDGTAPCLTTMGGGGKEPKIAAMRGRNPDNSSDRTTGGPTAQRLEVNSNGTSNCLTSVQKDNYVLEPKIQVKSATKQGYETATIGDSINLTHPGSKTRRGRVGKQVAQTLDCACNQAVVEPRVCEIRRDEGIRFFKDNICGTLRTIDCCGDKAVIEEYRIRKLTPLECFRLQDFPDEALHKAQQAGVSNSQLYKQAGNSMSVNVLEMIFNQIERSKNGEAPDGSLF